MSTAVPNTRMALTLALCLYLLWVIMTYLLESRILTFQRPEDIGARLLYVLQGAPTLNPTVIINAYAQALVGSIAEMLVCWAVVGSVAESLLRDGRGMWDSVILAAIIASVLFGVYHFAHSPPFNTVGAVAFLTMIGLVTSAFFFISRDVYGTITFHNFFGIFGVIGALDASANLATFERPVVPLFVTAVVAIAVLIAAHVLWI